MKKYDYVIVGGGLFAGTFAYFAKKAGKPASLWKREKPWEVISTVKISRESMSINTARIFFTRATGKYGILSTPL